MDSVFLLIGFIKSIGGPRTLIVLALGLVLGGYLVFQYFQGRKAEERRQSLAAGGDPEAVQAKRKDSLIAGAPVSVAARFPAIERLHLGGLLWPEAAARLAHTGYATREGLGRGQIILFADHPSYRRWVVESERMLVNAILLGPGLGTRWSSPW